MFDWNSLNNVQTNDYKQIEEYLKNKHWDI